ncbi:hypothetical protein ElyMa_007040700 [Elysia marginata]|uniref:Uncharacterized protein n=1 Tax=Elysia marginata TaxID=1093978 RepID=A0AAV4JTI9_9GAST|nr:hypothetical protein ElyMa_007040700 [Elysia marginata]
MNCSAKTITALVSWLGSNPTNRRIASPKPKPLDYATPQKSQTKFFLKKRSLRHHKPFYMTPISYGRPRTGFGHVLDRFWTGSGPVLDRFWTGDPVFCFHMGRTCDKGCSDIYIYWDLRGLLITLDRVVTSHDVRT